MADTRKNQDALSTTILLGAILLGLIWILSGGGLRELYTDAKSYEKEWAKVGRLESNGQYQSADRVVTRIQERARQKKNAFQEAKAIIAHMRLHPQFKEDWEALTVRAWKEAIPRWEFPYGQFGHSILGQFYWDYAQSNQWRLAGRSNVPDDTADFREWGIQRLALEADEHFQASLKAPDSLGKVGMKAFESMMLSWHEGQTYRPTLLDFLAWRALEFYEHPLTNATQARSATIEPAGAAFSDPKTFLKTQFATTDSSSFRFKALRIYQLLTHRHLRDRNPEAQLLVDIERMKAAQAIFPSLNGDSLRIHHLSGRMQDLEGKDGEGYCAAEIAKIYLSHPDTLVMPGADPRINNVQRALQVLEQATRDIDSELPGHTLCSNMIEKLQEKELQVKTREKLLPGQPSLISIGYKNLDSCWIRIARLDSGFNEHFYWREGERMDAMMQLPVVKEWLVDLPDASDGIAHRVMTTLPPLEQGKYAVLVRSNPEFSSDKELDGLGFITVNALSLWTSTTDNLEHEAYVMDRKTGRPVSGAQVDIWRARTEEGKETEHVTVGSWITGAQGYFRMAQHRISDTYYGHVIHGSDTLTFQNEREYFVPEPEEEGTLIHIFTDRTIYRPQQTVHFKGIVMTQGGGKPERLVTNSSRLVQLRDPNGKLLESQRLQTNDFGSYAGSFKLPAGQLSGEYRIQDESGLIHFNVEEYKRPQFEVVLDTVQGSHRVGEVIEVTGRGKTYAGANLTDAKVDYVVVRNVSWPWRYCFWDPSDDFHFSGGRKVVAEGRVVPDSLGNFKVRFLASPDPEEDYRRQPTFEYTVEVTVTDATGESHGNRLVTKLGYRSLGLDLGLPDAIDKDSFKGFNATTKNLNDQPVTTQGTIKVYRLAGPSQLWIPQDLLIPDRFLMSRDSFHRLFPHIVYDKSDLEGAAKRVRTVADLKFDSADQAPIQFPELPKWEQGWYEVEASCRDAYGQEVKYHRRLLVYGSLSDSIPYPSTLWMGDFSGPYEPGQVAVVDLASSFTDGYALLEIVRGNAVLDRRWIELSPKRTKIRFPIQESHRGGLHVNVHMLHDGEVFSESQTIDVPWTNKQLQIELATFRNKLEPGAREEWLLKIRGDKGQQVAAEVLAGMYDASLDAFKPHDWSLVLPSTRGPWQNRIWFVDHSTFSEIFCESDVNGSIAKRREFYLRYDALDLPALRMFTANQLHGRWADWEPPVFPPIYMKTWNHHGYTDNGVTIEDAQFTTYAASVGNVDASALSYNYAATSMPFPKGGVKADRIDSPTGGSTQRSRLDNVQIRKNLQETAFFYPQLRTDAAGNVILRFTMPEALTRWKLLTLAHTRDLRIGNHSAEVVTQKDLMIQPNAPRFFREDDRIHYTARITNLSGRDLSGVAQLELLDAKTDRPIDSLLGNAQPILPFSLKAGQTKAVSWALRIPRGIEAVTHRVKAVADKFSDGEESVIPVLPNAMLVTEALPMPLRPKQSRTFEFKRLLTANSPTMRHHRYTVEFTSNPAWYAVQSLPYLMEFPYECMEQTFSRYYANALASHILNRHPRIKTIFEKWKAMGKDAAISRLARNPELKTVLIEETPWLMEGRSEEDRLRNLGFLFDLQRMTEEKDKIKRTLIREQNRSGSFSWFKGMPESPYITRHIVAGFGHLLHLGVDGISTDPGLMRMITKAVHYNDTQMASQYAQLKKVKNVNLASKHIGWSEIHFLYGRSFFPNIEYAAGCKEGMLYYLGQAKQHWKSLDLYAQGMAALALHRSGDKATPPAIMASIKDRALHSDELGMYWKSNEWYLWWYESPIETHALLIEAFHEVTQDHESVEEMKLWLLKQKESRDWGTTRATVEASNALLNLGTDLLAESQIPAISVGGTLLNATNSPEVRVQAGTGYMKKTYQGSEVRPALGKVQVSNPNKVVAWGGLYWQYFEQMDKVTSAKGKCSIEKELLVANGGKTFLKYEPAKDKLHPGDQIRVRLKVTADRALQYVHVKDLRASGMEPEDVLSGYSYEGGLSLYKTTRDASTNFFIEDFPAGTHILEYDLRAVHVGDFASGAATMQCMYAPEFTSHTAGRRVSIENP